jgi:hypothetical protein
MSASVGPEGAPPASAAVVNTELPNNAGVVSLVKADGTLHDPPYVYVTFSTLNVGPIPDNPNIDRLKAAVKITVAGDPHEDVKKKFGKTFGKTTFNPIPDLTIGTQLPIFFNNNEVVAELPNAFAYRQTILAAGGSVPPLFNIEHLMKLFMSPPVAANQSTKSTTVVFKSDSFIEYKRSVEPHTGPVGVKFENNTIRRISKEDSRLAVFVALTEPITAIINGIEIECPIGSEMVVPITVQLAAPAASAVVQAPVVAAPAQAAVQARGRQPTRGMSTSGTTAAPTVLPTAAATALRNARRPASPASSAASSGASSGNPRQSTPQNRDELYMLQAAQQRLTPSSFVMNNPMGSRTTSPAPTRGISPSPAAALAPAANGILAPELSASQPSPGTSTRTPAAPWRSRWTGSPPTASG